MTIKVAINGYGRIGRNVLRALYESGRNNEIQVVAINDLGDAETNAHLTQYDTAHGKFPGTVIADGGDLLVNGDRIKVYAVRNPADIPWGAHDVDVVLEAKVVLPAFLCPACIDVLLRQFGRALAPVNGYSILLDDGVVFAAVALDRHGNESGVDDLSALEFNTEVSQRLTQAIKQGFGQLVCLEGFSKCPDGAGIGYVAR